MSNIIKKNVVYHDLPIYFYNDSSIIKKSKIQFYKNFSIYRKFINNWPVVYGTSCLFFNRKLLQDFFSLKKIFNFSYLAIDVKIALFAEKFYKYKIINKRLTFKRSINNSLDAKYNKVFTKIFWLRRYQQFQFQKYIGKSHFPLSPNPNP
jgi:hypothetical protein